MFSRAWPWSLGLLALPALAAPQPADVQTEAVRRLAEAAGGRATFVRSEATGGVTFLSAAGGAGIPVGASPTAPADGRALAFLATHGGAFFIHDKEQLRVRRVSPADASGIEHVRLQQLHRGVPVTAGELIVHLRGEHVTAVNGQTLDGLEVVETTPAVTAGDAREAARTALEKKHGLTGLTFGEPRLEVFNRGLLEKRRYPTRLAWFVEASGPQARRFVWVDALRGHVLLEFSQRPHALVRQVYSSAGTPAHPGTLIRSEGGAASGDLDVDRAYDYMGSAHAYFMSEHGRDSYNGIGGMLRATVDFCPSGGPCPYVNAFWQDDHLTFGDGMSRADDVVAHELAHGVTEYTANLFYYMQSGALNEAFSDVFGESVDLMNGLGNDTPAMRWVSGEDLPVVLGVGVRHMMNPNAFGDPGKMSDTAQFDCGTPGGDLGGVHGNSGIANHAYALMVDGGTYNGRTITGLGLSKAGKVMYRALAQYLTSASGFLDAYHAIKQSCHDLVGVAGITVADCWQVTTALDAVEMADPVPCAGAGPRGPALCPLGQAPSNVFFDDLETAPGTNWGIQRLVGPTDPPSQVWFIDDAWASSGDIHLLGLDQPFATDHRLLTNPTFVVPANARLHFNHGYGFENGTTAFYDGGVVEYRTESPVGPWLDAGSLLSAGQGYDGALSTAFGNPLAGRQAFSGDSHGYTGSRYNLSSLAGQTIRWAFRIGSDTSDSDFGWFIDDVRLYTCQAPSDLIFADGFDSNNVTAWSQNQIDLGDLSTGAGAALASSPFGLQGTIDDTTSLFVQDNTPNAENRYRSRFYLDPNTFDPGEAQAHLRTRVFIGLQQVPETRRLFAIVLRRQGGQYAIMGRARLDSGAQADTGFFNITNAPHSIEIDWVRSGGPDANNGTFELWIDGVSMKRMTGLDNSVSGVDAARLGALSVKTGASGVLFWDHFESRRQTYIGP